MKIFITGATGFIGTHVVRRLAQTHHKMFCLARKTSDVTHLKELGANIITGDATDKEWLLKGMIGCDCVVNLANLYSFWEPDRKIYTKINIEGTRNVMESVLEKGISKVVHISAAGIFGKPADFSFTEDSPVGPIQFSEYFRTKYGGGGNCLGILQEKRIASGDDLPWRSLGSG